MVVEEYPFPGLRLLGFLLRLSCLCSSKGPEKKLGELSEHKMTLLIAANIALANDLCPWSSYQVPWHLGCSSAPVLLKCLVFFLKSKCLFLYLCTRGQDTGHGLSGCPSSHLYYTVGSTHTDSRHLEILPTILLGQKPILVINLFFSLRYCCLFGAADLTPTAATCRAQVELPRSNTASTLEKFNAV